MWRRRRACVQYANASTDAYSFAHTDSCTDANAHTDTYTYTHPNPNAYAYAVGPAAGKRARGLRHG